MNRFHLSRIFVAVAACAGVSNAQKITVPLHDPSRPAQIHANVLNGGITVRGYDGKEVLVETAAGAAIPQRDEPERARGMHRLEVPGAAGLDVIEEDNVVTIKTERASSGAQLTITVPRRSSVQLKGMNGGDLTVEGVNGEIEANNLNGKIILRNVSGSVVAHSLNGEVLATIDRPDPSKPMSFSSLNGDIDVTLPDDIKANFKMKTAHREVFSDFEVKLASNAPTPVPDPDERRNGRFRVRVDSSMHGAVNGGGPEYQFTTFNGHIYIRKKK
jgi:hypothetical protein